MGCNSSSPTSEPEPEVEAGAEDRTPKNTTQARVQEAEEDFNNDEDFDLEELGVHETTLKKLDTIESKHVDQLIKRVKSHFLDQETMDAQSLGHMLGLCTKESLSTTPICVQKIHDALSRQTKVPIENTTMDVTQVVEAMLHLHGCAGDAQSKFLYDHVYGQSTKNVKLKFIKVQEIATSLLESAADIKEFQQECKRLEVFNLEGGLKEDVKEIMNSYLAEQLDSKNGDGEVSQEKFQVWVEKCQTSSTRVAAERKQQ